MFETFLATGRVLLDKTIEYTYTPNTPRNNELNKNDDSIKITKYEDEDKSNRILKEVGYYEEYRYFFSEPTHIIDNIYLGSAFNASNYSGLKKLDIKFIINVTGEISERFPNNFKYVRYDLKDNNEHSIYEYLDDAYNNIIDFQKNNHGNILVHCFMGRSRSASIVIYYLMKTQKNKDGSFFNFDEALAFLKEKRPIVNPTFRFAKDLERSVINN